MLRHMIVHILSPVTDALSYQWTPPGKKKAGVQPSAQGFSILPTDCSHALGERVTLK